MDRERLVRTRYRVVVRRPGTSRVRAVLNAGPDAVRILGGRFTTESAILEVEVRSRPEELPYIESVLSRHADVARSVPL